MSIPTEITVYPNYDRPEPTFGVRTPGDTDEARLDDLTTSANPLHYVPFVGQVYEAMSGNTGSAALKVIGGALLGGPIGLLAGIANAVFEQATGDSVVQAVASALSGDEPITRLASARVEENGTIRTAQAEILPPELPTAAGNTLPTAPMQVASAVNMSSAPASANDRDILALFGGQTPSAHRSYQKAQMLPYLQDVSTSLVM